MIVTKFRNLSLALAAACAVALPMQAQAASVDVDLELALLIDVSGSVNTTEYNLQLQGYVDAFNSAAVQNAIGSGALGSIAASVVFWSGSGSQAQSIDWTLIDSNSAAGAFATALSNLTRPFFGNTAPGSAIDYIVNGAPNTFAANDFNGTRNVIDVSGDGTQNSGISTSGARDAALANGIDAINGIAIGGSASVNAFYQNSVVGGTNSFFVSADSFLDFGSAVERKLVAEITDNPPAVPLPAAAWMLLAGVGGLGALKRFKKPAA